MAVTDENGDLVERITYSAYGATSFWWNPDWTGTGYQGYAGLSKVGLPYSYTGQRLDGETGLYYYKNRTYDPKLGRFLSRDRLGYADGMSLYQYGASNPAERGDPLGLWGSTGKTAEWQWMQKLQKQLSLYPGPKQNHSPSCSGLSVSWKSCGEYNAYLKQKSEEPGNTVMMEDDFQAARDAGYINQGTHTVLAAAIIKDLPRWKKKKGVTTRVTATDANGKYELGTTEYPQSEFYAGEGGFPTRYRFSAAANAAAAVQGAALSPSDFSRALGVAWWAVNKYNPQSVRTDTEYAGLVYMNSQGDFVATEAVPGKPCAGQITCGSDPWNAKPLVPAGATVVLDYHTHGAAPPGSSFEFFSKADWLGIDADAQKNPGYVGGVLGTPAGDAYFYPGGALPPPYSVPAMQATQIHLQSIAH